MRRLLALIVISLFVVAPLSVVNARAQEVEKVASISGLGNLLVNIAVPDILDILSNLTVIVSIQRPDTYEFVDPDELTVTIDFMGFRMAQKDLTQMKRISRGIYVAYFKPIGIPLLLDINVKAEWVAPWGERVDGEAKKNVLLDFFYNITGRLKMFFQQFFEDHNVTAYLHSLYENFTSTFSKWVQAFERFATIVRLTFGNLFSLKQGAWSKVVVLNVTELQPLVTWNASLDSEIISILQKARLIPSIKVVNSLQEFYSILYNDSEINVILVDLGKYFPLPQLNTSWEEEIRNITVTMASKHWRVILFSEPFRYLYNSSYLNVGTAGWNETLLMSGVVLWGEVPQYKVVTGASLAGTTLIDKILAEFNITIPYTASGDVIGVPDTLATDYAYSIVGTSLVTLFRIDAPTGLSIIVGIPSMFQRSLLFGIGMIGWQINEFFERVIDILKNEISDAIYGLPFYSQLQSMIADLENLVNGNYNASTIFNKIIDIAEWLIKVLVNPWQMLLGGLGGEFTSTESEIAKQNEDIYYAAGSFSDVVVSSSNIQSQILQHVQALYATTLFSMLSNLPHLVAVAVDEAKRGHWAGSINITEAFLEPAMYEDRMSAEDAILLANRTISVVNKMISNSTENPYLNLTANLIDILNNACSIVNDILSLLRGNFTVSASGLKVTSILGVVWDKLTALGQTVNLLQNSLSNLWTSVSKLTSGVSSLFSQVSSIWNYLPNFVGNIQNWISTVQQNLQAALSGAVAEVKYWVLNYVYEPLQRFVGSALSGLRNAFEQFQSWVLGELPSLKAWVLNKVQLLGNEIAQLWNYVQSHLLGPLIDGAEQFIMDAKDAILAFGEYLKNSLTWLWDRIRDIASNILTFFRNLPDFIISALREYGATFLRISWKVIKASVEYVLQRVLAAFGINYNRLVGAVRSIWSAIFKVVDFVKSALNAIPQMFDNFADRLKEMISTIVDFIKSSFERASEIIGNLFSKFSNITHVFTAFAGFLSQAKEFVNRLVNISTWISVIKYALDNLKQKTRDIVEKLTIVGKQALELGMAYKGESIRVVQRGSMVYFMYEHKGKIVRGVPLKVTIADPERVYGYAIASEVAPGLYAVDLKNLNLKEGEYFIFVEKMSLEAAQFETSSEPPTAVAGTIYYKEAKAESGPIAGYLIAKVPSTLYADRANKITITIVNQRNSYADCDLVITLFKGKVPYAQYSEIVHVGPGNTTLQIAFGPFYFSLPGAGKIKIELRHPTGTTTIEVDVKVVLGLGNWLTLAGIGTLLATVAYNTYVSITIRKRK